MAHHPKKTKEDEQNRQKNVIEVGVYVEKEGNMTRMKWKFLKCITQR